MVSWVVVDGVCNVIGVMWRVDSVVVGGGQCWQRHLGDVAHGWCCGWQWMHLWQLPEAFKDINRLLRPKHPVRASPVTGNFLSALFCTIGGAGQPLLWTGVCKHVNKV